MLTSKLSFQTSSPLVFVPLFWSLSFSLVHDLFWSFSIATSTGKTEAEILTCSERFQIINTTIRLHELRRMTRYLCQLLEVSINGYYRWLRAEQTRQQREYQDEQDGALIKEHFNALRGKVGARAIKMRLEQQSQVIVNHKKIRRLMKKYHLVATIRRANPYRKMAMATQEQQTCPNHLERQFDQAEVEKVFLIDITYLYYSNGQTAYLSVVKDGSTRQVPAHYLSL